MSQGQVPPKKLAAELTGTSAFVLVGAGSAVAFGSLAVSDPFSSFLVTALANGLGLAFAVSATMSISGGSLNPAVTIGLLASKKIRRGDVLPYIVAELLGGALAGAAPVVSPLGSLPHRPPWSASTMGLRSSF